MLESPATDPGRAAEEMREIACHDCGASFAISGEPFVNTCDECLRAEGARLAEEAANFRNPIPPPIPVRGGYYLTECGHCGWIGSSEQCLPSEEDVVCPVCCSVGCEDEPSEKDTEVHGEAVMQRIIAAEAEAAQLRARLHEDEKGAEAMRERCTALERSMATTYHAAMTLRPIPHVIVNAARCALGIPSADLTPAPEANQEAGDGR